MQYTVYAYIVYLIEIGSFVHVQKYAYAAAT